MEYSFPVFISLSRMAYAILIRLGEKLAGLIRRPAILNSGAANSSISA